MARELIRTGWFGEPNPVCNEEQLVKTLQQITAGNISSWKSSWASEDDWAACLKWWCARTQKAPDNVEEKARYSLKYWSVWNLEMSAKVFFVGLSQQIPSHLVVRSCAMKSIWWLRNQWMRCVKYCWKKGRDSKCCNYRKSCMSECAR